MREICLSAEVCADPALMHQLLAQDLSFPDTYGKNLDALYDCLTDLREEVTIRLPAADLGDFGLRLCRVLMDSARENPCLYVVQGKKE